MQHVIFLLTLLVLPQESRLSLQLILYLCLELLDTTLHMYKLVQPLVLLCKEGIK